MRNIFSGIFRRKMPRTISLALSLSKGAGWYCNDA
jgi:hypothetical protein